MPGDGERDEFHYYARASLFGEQIHGKTAGNGVYFVDVQFARLVVEYEVYARETFGLNAPENFYRKSAYFFFLLFVYVGGELPVAAALGLAVVFFVVRQKLGVRNGFFDAAGLFVARRTYDGAV